ncbi:MAG: hypothetical protein MJ104_06365 [Lachnospiraceae bacterium]|nr:hypothetical protein [Lachnospiraceae bacterium]
MKKKRSLIEIIKYIFLATILIVVGIILFFQQIDYACKRIFSFPMFLSFFFGCAILGILFFALYSGRKKIQKNRYVDLLIVIASIVHFLLLLFMSYHYYFKTGWDVHYVMLAAEDIAKYGELKNGIEGYFSIYPNNLTLSIIFSFVVSAANLLGYGNAYYACIMAQCLILAISSFLVYLNAKIICGKVEGIVAYIIFVALFGLSPWVVVPYSDTMSMIFPLLELLVYLLIRNKKKGVLLTVLLGVLTVLGYSIKPQSIIITIAIIGVEGVHFFENAINKEKVKKALYYVIAFMVGFAIMGFTIKMLPKLYDIELDKERETNIWYYFLTGMREDSDGVCNVDDYMFADQIETSSERVKILREAYVDRLKTYTPDSFIRFMTRKTLCNYADGTFAWWEEGEFYSYDLYSGNSKIRDFLRSFYYVERENFIIYADYCQIIWCGILGISFIGGLINIIKKRKVSREINIIMLGFIGLTLFEWIFEARARYLFHFGGIYVLLSVCALKVIFEVFENAKNKRNTQKR